MSGNMVNPIGVPNELVYLHIPILPKIGILAPQMLLDSGVGSYEGMKIGAADDISNTQSAPAAPGFPDAAGTLDESRAPVALLG